MVNVKDSAGSDIDRSSTAGAVQDGRYDQLERFLGGIRVGGPRRRARDTRHQSATHRLRLRVNPLQDQVRRRRRTSHEEDDTQSTEAAPIFHPTLTP